MELQRGKEQPLEKCRKCSSRYRKRSIAGFRPCSPCKNREVPGCGVRASRATVILRQCGRTPKVHGAPERARVTINGISLIGHLIGCFCRGPFTMLTKKSAVACSVLAAEIVILAAAVLLLRSQSPRTGFAAVT